MKQLFSEMTLHFKYGQHKEKKNFLRDFEKTVLRKNPSLNETLESFTDPQLLSHFYRRIRELSTNNDDVSYKKREE